jgi:ABC-type amino acid transport system permease subunit
MQGIYTYIPETNHVPRDYIVAAILSLLFIVSISPVPALALLYFYVSTFRSMFVVVIIIIIYLLTHSLTAHSLTHSLTPHSLTPHSLTHS